MKSIIKFYETSQPSFWDDVVVKSASDLADQTKEGFKRYYNAGKYLTGNTDLSPQTKQRDISARDNDLRSLPPSQRDISARDNDLRSQMADPRVYDSTKKDPMSPALAAGLGAASLGVAGGLTYLAYKKKKQIKNKQDI